MSDVNKVADRIVAVEEMMRTIGQLRSAKAHFDKAVVVFERAADRVSRIIEDSQKEADDSALRALACWMGGSDTGSSSMAIAVATITGNAGKGMPPPDTADFGRCYRLLKAHPMCAEGLALLGKSGSPVWRAMVASWGELTTLYEAIGYEAAGNQAPRRARYGQEESPERIAYEAACEAMYLRMKQIIREAQHPVRRVEAAASDDDRYVLARLHATGWEGENVAWLAGKNQPQTRWITPIRERAMEFSKAEAEVELARLRDTAPGSSWSITPSRSAAASRSTPPGHDADGGEPRV